MTLPATLFVCSLYTTLWTGYPVTKSVRPRGSCFTCCEINEKNDIKFMLYTRENLLEPQYLYLNDSDGLHKSNFNFDKPLKMYMHGFTETAKDANRSSQSIKNAFLESRNYNVIIIDWSPLTAGPWYSQAVENVPVAGIYVANFIQFLLNEGYALHMVHVIGFSLGAELAGYIGKELRERGTHLPRITGLDPAMPSFGDTDTKNHRLGPEDAEFVDVIHTDGGFLGHIVPMGHADFYPNNGRAMQPGCKNGQNTNGVIKGILSCSHHRAWRYFIESIRFPFAFPIKRCQASKLFGPCPYGKAFMGMRADRSLRGKFFLFTNDAPPYGRKIKSFKKKDQTQQ